MGYAPIPLLEITLEVNLPVAPIYDLHDVKHMLIRYVARFVISVGSKFDSSEEILPEVWTP